MDVAVSIERLGTKSVTYGFEFTKDGQVIARGQVSSVCCRILDDHKMESMTIPASFRARIEAAN